MLPSPSPGGGGLHDLYAPIHAHVILENFLGPYLFNGVPTDPGVDIVSIYADHDPAKPT
ncbi:MAG: hypothetical protein Ct9H300mP1_32260 [Planctomycetaceae bacterium]|nr:MAG: hypothetical protein Ct9H300mP1_32260 [Planctomycetaceae bacterium]